MKLFKARSQNEVFNSLVAFFFPGRAIEFINDTSDPMGALINALASEIRRVLNSMNDLSEDYDILVTDQLLTRWESALGIPDSCFPATGSKAERRLHVLLKFAKMNVQTAEQMRQLAVALGFTDTVVQPLIENSLPPYDVPFIPSTSPNNRYIIQVTASGAITNFPPYDVPFIPFSDNQSLLACIFNIIKPANCKVVFSNTPPIPTSPLVYNAVGWYDGADINAFTLDGGEITSWNNKGVGSGGDLAQFLPPDDIFPIEFPVSFYSTDERPTFVATVQNGQSIVRFTGNQLLTSLGGDVLSVPAADNTIMMVIRKNDSDLAEFVMNWANGGEIQQFVSYQDDAVATGDVLSNPDVVEGQFELLTIQKEGATQSIQVDDNTIVTNEGGSVGLVADIFELGGFGANFRLSADIGEIAIFPTALSASQVAVMKDYFRTKWGI